MAWSNKPGTQRDLPANWPELVAACKAAAGGRCEWILPSGKRCPRAGTDADHYGRPWEHHLLRWLCDFHHKKRTAKQGLQARTKKTVTRKRRHPGAIPD